MFFPNPSGTCKLLNMSSKRIWTFPFASTFLKQRMNFYLLKEYSSSLRLYILEQTSYLTLSGAVCQSDVNKYLDYHLA